MTQSTWSVSEPLRLSFEEPVAELSVRVVNGAVNVVGVEPAADADGAGAGTARLEVTQIEGPPLRVTLADGVLTVAYDDLPWTNFKTWLDRETRQRAAVVSLAVPAATRVQVGSVGATTVVSGIAGPAEVRAVNGDVTLTGLTGEVRAHTVTGAIEAQSVTGGLVVRSVSGEITVVDGPGAGVKAESVSGDMVLDLDPGGRPAEINVTSVSGRVAIRLPHPSDARVDANTAGGAVSTAFEDLRVSGQFGTKRITGTLGAGTGTLKATTLSGSIALLRRPEPAADDAPPAPGREPEPAAGRATDEAAPAPAAPDLDKKVL